MFKVLDQEIDIAEVYIQIMQILFIYSTTGWVHIRDYITIGAIGQ